MPADQSSNVPEPAKPIGKNKSRAEEPVREKKIILDPDENLQFSDDLAFEETFGAPAGATAVTKMISTLVVLAVIAMVGYLVLLVIYPDEFGSENWIGVAAVKKPGTSGEAEILLRGFELGGIQLGTPADKVHKLYPEMRFTPHPKGGRIGTFLHHEGEYRVFFHGLEKNVRSWRIESRHVYTKISYLELLSELSQRYGQPTGSDCDAGVQVIAIECDLVWSYPAFNLSAQIKTTVSEDANQASTSLGIIAIDLRPDKVFSRPAKKNRSLKDVRRP